MGTFRDTDAEDEKFVVTPTGGTATDYMVNDAETQEYLLTHPLSNDNVIKEGDQPELRLEAKPPISGDVTFRINLSSAQDSNDYYLTSTTGNGISQNFDVAGATGDSMVDVPLFSVTNDVDRVDDTVTLVALTTVATTDMPIGTEVARLELTVLDQHMLPSVAIDGIAIPVGTPPKATPVSPAMTLVEGEIGTVKLVADRGTTTDQVNDNEAITVTLTLADSSTADRGDYDIDGSPVSIAAAAGKGGSGTFTVDVDEDQDVGQEMLVLMVTIAGDKANGTETKEMILAAIALTDKTLRKIEPKADDVIYAAIMAARAKGAGDNGRWTPGETMTLAASDLFTWPATTTSVVLGNAISEDQQIATAVTSNDNLTITAVGGGMTEITVTGTVTSESSSVMTSQTLSNAATVKFPIEVDAPAITEMPQADVDAAVDAAIKKAADMASSKQWEPEPAGGATAMVALSDLFDVPDSIRAIYDAESSDMGDIEAGISSDKMYVTLMPKSAGTAMITVTAADTASGGSTATVSFDATVVAQAAIVAKSQAEVNKVFMDADADELVAGGSAVMVDMSQAVHSGARRNAHLHHSVQRGCRRGERQRYEYDADAHAGFGWLSQDHGDGHVRRQ